MTDARCFLRLENLVFDELYFKRCGFSSESELKLNLEASVGQLLDKDVFKATIILQGEKKDEYTMKISITGFFSFDSDNAVSEETKSVLLSKNALAILMPYLRSEVSLLTAQPGVAPIVLPPININNFIGNADNNAK